LFVGKKKYNSQLAKISSFIIYTQWFKFREIVIVNDLKLYDFLSGW